MQFKSITIIVGLALAPASAATNAPTDALAYGSRTELPARGNVTHTARLLKLASQEQAAETPAPEQKKVCEAASLRHCSNQCDGVYGMFCFPSTVCNPVTHRCEKTSP